MATLHNTFGIAARNFTAYPEMPDIKALVEYGVKMEEMGFDSIWARHFFFTVRCWNRFSRRRADRCTIM